MIEALKSGSCAGLVLQDTVKMGYESVKVLAAAIGGQKPEPFVSTGEYFASPGNFDTEEIKQLLKPRWPSNS